LSFKEKYRYKAIKEVELTKGYSSDIIKRNIFRLVDTGDFSYAKAERVARKFALKYREKS